MFNSVTYLMLSSVQGKRSQNTEDYVNFVGDIIYPKKIYGPYGFHADKLRVIILVVGENTFQGFVNSSFSKLY